MKKTIVLIVFVLLIFLSRDIVYAGRGCCSGYHGVDKSRCTTDGRQVCNDTKNGQIVISNGDSCKCDPNEYDESNLVDPSGQYGTNPYGHSSNYNNNNSKKNEGTDLDSNNNESDSFMDYVGPIILTTGVAAGGYTLGKKK